MCYFYPRSPCGERPGLGVGIYLVTEISIHALLAESDSCTAHNRRSQKISIHALLAESDVKFQLDFINQKEFLSTLSLRRATVNEDRYGQQFWRFLSTLSLRRATSAAEYNTLVSYIFLSTLSLRRATGFKSSCGGFTGNFYPRSPCGERPLAGFLRSLPVIISIHALLAESDLGVSVQWLLGIDISIHALLAESDS